MCCARRCLAAPPLSALTGAEVYVKYENLQVTNSFKERGACVKLAALGARRAPPRRDRHVGRQPCPGGGLSCPPPCHPGDHRHAGDDAVREGQGDRGARRDRRAVRRDAAGSPGARRGDRGRARSGLGASLRRSAHHRRPGHHCAGNAGGRAGSRGSGRSDRRRRADRRQCHRGARAKAVDRDRSASNARSIRRCGMRSIAATGRAAARRSPKASR